MDSQVYGVLHTTRCVLWDESCPLKPLEEICRSSNSPTCEGDLLGKSGLCRRNQVKIRSYRSRVDPKSSMTTVLIRRPRKDPHWQRPCDNKAEIGVKTL